MPPSEEKVAEMDFDVGDLPTNDSNESELHQEEKKPDVETCLWIAMYSIGRMLLPSAI